MAIYATMSANRKIKMKNWNPPNHKNHFSHCKIAPFAVARRLGRAHSGFSLVELVFAMMFLTIIILGVVNLQTSSLGMLNGQKNQIQAHFLAMQGVQIVKALGYGTIDTAFSAPGSCPDPAVCYKTIASAASSYSLAAYAPADEIKIGNQIFQRKIQIVSDATNLLNAYTIRSIVEWEDSSGPHFKDRIDPVTGQPMNSQVETDLIVF